MPDRHRADLIGHLERVHGFDATFRLGRAADWALDSLHDIEHRPGASLAHRHTHDYLRAGAA